jgi:hypothetical protein
MTTHGFPLVFLVDEVGIGFDSPVSIESIGNNMKWAHVLRNN